MSNKKLSKRQRHFQDFSNIGQMMALGTLASIYYESEVNICYNLHRNVIPANIFGEWFKEYQQKRKSFIKSKLEICLYYFREQKTQQHLASPEQCSKVELITRKVFFISI